jgi:hypothetical protein
MRAVSIAMAGMLLYSPAWSAGPGWIGSIRSSGVVLANSTPMPDGGSIRSGDRITAGAGSLAVVHLPANGRVEVRSESAARLDAGRILLERGAVASNRLPIDVSGYTIRPENPEGAWYAVAHRDGKLVVAAHRGNLLLAAAGAAPLRLLQGAVAERQTAAGQNQTPPPENEEEQQDRRRGGGAVPGAVAGGGWTIGGLSHAASVALVVGIGAGVAAASVGAALALSDDNPSPSQ